jgi:hypothetical protein
MPASLDAVVGSLVNPPCQTLFVAFSEGNGRLCNWSKTILALKEQTSEAQKGRGFGLLRRFCDGCVVHVGNGVILCRVRSGLWSLQTE